MGKRLPGWVRAAAVAAIVLVLVGAGLLILNYERRGRYLQSTNDATIQADQVAISSKLGGYVSTVSVDDNQAVGRGALLVQIDPVDYGAKRDQADAAIAVAISSERVARASQAEAVAGVAQARAVLEAAQATRDFAVREVARYKPLVANGAEPATTLSQLDANLDHASAEVIAGRAALRQAQSHVETLAAQAAELTAQARAARVQRAAAGNDLSFTRLVSPIAGRVANRSARVGQYVQPGIRLMTIVPEEGIYVVANFKETQVGLMRPGEPATIRVDALPSMRFTGVVSSVTPGTGANFSLVPPQNSTGNFTKIVQRVPVRIRIDAGPVARRMLVPGLSLTVEVDTRAGLGDLKAMKAEQDQTR